MAAPPSMASLPRNVRKPTGVLYPKTKTFLQKEERFGNLESSGAQRLNYISQSWNGRPVLTLDAEAQQDLAACGCLGTDRNIFFNCFALLDCSITF